MAKIDTEATKMAIVVDSERYLLGTVTDGDIRRGLLSGMQLTDPVERCMCQTPTTARVGESSEAILSKMRKLGLHQVPILDERGCVADLVLIKDYLLIPERKNWVVIMAGGPGTRLDELTRNTPKPMLQVGDKPLLETIVYGFVKQGFRHIWIAVNYHAGQIEDHFGDGKQFGAVIRYLREAKRLGTAGALSLLPHVPEHPVLVTNADLLSNVDYGAVLDQHVSVSVTATMAVREHEYQIPYGVVRTEKENILRLDEKPVHKVLVNAGVYVLSPEAIACVPIDTFFDMPELFEILITKGKQVRSHLVDGYWRDIGCHEDFCKANSDFHEVFRDSKQ
ncbi:MAG: nucleotidyltransferase family protein [Desulfomonilaceae bacterium]|jgi:dTDP-glucose pyrophosphorylase